MYAQRMKDPDRCRGRSASIISGRQGITAAGQAYKVADVRFIAGVGDGFGHGYVLHESYTEVV